MSWSVSRILLMIAIYLDPTLPWGSSNLPECTAGHRYNLSYDIPIWFCSTRGLPCRHVLPLARCALTAPFHPYPIPSNALLGTRWFLFCCTFCQLTLPGSYPARHPVESGLSSPLLSKAATIRPTRLLL